MNGLLAAIAVANPVITALLTIIIFLEKDKLRKRSEELESAIRQCNQELVQAVANQSISQKPIHWVLSVPETVFG